LYICNLKINKSIWYVCNRRDSGQQFKVSKDLKVYVHRLASEEGSKISFDKVLLLDDNGNILNFRRPAIEGASVEAKVLQHLKVIKLSFSKEKKKRIQRNGTDNILLKL
jgi:large subunit ribosomal protein L21